MTKAEMVITIVKSEAEEFLLTEEQVYERTEELLVLSMFHILDLFRCRFEVDIRHA